MPIIVSPYQQIGQKSERFARGAQTDGQRLYTVGPNSGNAPLCDPHGRLLVRTSGPYGYDTPQASQVFVGGLNTHSGSAPQEDNLGIVQSARAMPSADIQTLTAGSPRVHRLFGYSTIVGWVQLILKDESAGVNPPVLNDVPEVTIPVGQNQNFVFGDWLLATGAAAVNLSVYIVISSTGPTYTPIVAPNGIWFSFYGGV